MFNKVLTVLFVSFLLHTNPLQAQDVATIRSIEDSLVKTIDSMYENVIPDERVMSNERIIKQLVRALKVSGSYNYRFDSLAKRISIIYPEDKSFRIFNWAVPFEENTRRYYGAIQMNSEQLKLYPLIDCSTDLGKGTEDSVLRNGKWYGGLYYRIIPHEVDGNTVYTMFGINAGNPITNKKFLDAMTITDKGPVFGAPIFNIRSKNIPTERIKRFVMEYKKQVQASLNWDTEMGAIYLDHLESEVNDPNRKYTFVPTGQYDGFKWIDGYWNFIPDLIPIDALKDGQAPIPQPFKGREN